MAFPANVLASGVKIASNLTRGVQAQVTLRQRIGQDAFGKKTYAEPIHPKCIIDRTNRVIQISGQMVTIAATLTFLEPVPSNGSAGRREPIDPRDEITLPDGFTGPIIDAPGAVTNPDTGKGFTTQVMLGAR